MIEKLNLKTTPEYVSCEWFGENRKINVSLDGSTDALLMCFGGKLSLAGGLFLGEGKYIILHGNGQGWISPPEKKRGLLCIYFNGNYNQSDECISMTGDFDCESVSKYVNRLREIYEKRINSEPIQHIEQQALFCNILSSLLNFSSLSNSKNLARNIMQEIVENAEREIDLDYLSTKFFYSKNYIISAFNKEYHTTPYKHLIKIRVSLAMEKLESTTKNCQEIAYEVGFHDMTTFFRAFKSITGISPSAWRNLKKQEKEI